MYTSTGQGILGNNMFAYCRNNPVCRRDVAGATDEKCYDGASDPLGDDEELTGGKMGRNSPDRNSNSSPGGQKNRIGGSGHGGHSLSNASSASSNQAHAPRFTPDQQAVLELAGEYKSGVTMDEASILVDYACEYGISNHAPMIHPGRSGFWSGILHVKIKNFHIPVIK